MTRGLEYPPARQGDQVDVYHGERVADPYRWLEDPDSEESRRWIEAQNRLTESFLQEAPRREAFRKRLSEIWNYERYGLPFREGRRWFYTYNSGLQNQPVLHVTSAPDKPGRVLLDPNTLSADGTVAVSDMRVSRDGSHLAYALSRGGSDWRTWHVRDVRTGRDLPDRLEWSKFAGAAWTLDGKGFFYARYAAPSEGSSLRDQNRVQQIRYHRLGEPQSEDVLVYSRPDQPDWFFGISVTEDGRYLVLEASLGTERKNRVFYMDLLDPRAPAVDGGRSPVRPLIPEADALYDFIGAKGKSFWFRADREAPRGRVIRIDLESPAPDRWQVAIPEQEHPLESVSMACSRLFAVYLKDVAAAVRIYPLSGGKAPVEVALPGLGSVGGFRGYESDRQTYFSYTSFNTPAAQYRLEARDGEASLFRRPKVAFDTDRYETRQVFYRSKDGTRVPMFLTHRKGLRPDGNLPVLLYGYGGFNSAQRPAFSSMAAVWMETGGVYAVANIRGGGEYGREWHQAGTRLRRQNVFDDFIAAGEWLTNNGYTSPRRLAISGGSNGGLLVAACAAQRPDLFGAVLPAVGVLDMLRFHKFTIGWAWVSDYGSPENPEEFKALLAYSPLHNLQRGKDYPATLITTGDHDDRVVPAHSFKYAATLQAAQGGRAPVLIRIETRAGHGAGKPTEMLIRETADRLAFLARVLDL